ncbi:hypothetical protein HNQ96_004445 [Aminobacter lissarensis]|uniref:Pyridoxal phosphate homeostasis protein n=1 Tax=Aminobacter carboxidus TaxID=376165 RepID=A0A8E2BDD1_9HYPH|nr:YggS family pyridoxal phosphate-dependent enzyme [Aminobacter lissarensis]MBB6468561.1 hypothetical protein [Aminobacter lissarensis]
MTALETDSEALCADASQLSVTDVERFGSNPMATFSGNLRDVRARIERASRRAGRNPAQVRLLPIGKTVPAHILRFAVRAGLTALGENRVLEARAKHDALADLSIDWAIVGHLQTNKAKELVKFACEFHALDSIRVAQMLNGLLDAQGRSLPVYIQVNTSGENSKFGLHPEAVMPFVDVLAGFPRLLPRGLMTLALFSADLNKVRPCFQLLRRLRDRAVLRNAALTELSMGMSGDFEVAIEEGADVVRISAEAFDRECDVRILVPSDSYNAGAPCCLTPGGPPWIA